VGLERLVQAERIRPQLLVVEGVEADDLLAVNCCARAGPQIP
jgi:hypothetical protein